ncbi:MAG: ABC transporter ATP-binding protein [Albidovulum sp.]|nr:ABC transporter ATP-binding protein [Albidovulum sp.]
MNSLALRLSQIEKVYNRGTTGEVPVLQGVDLELSRGQTAALLAPSGAGKSTLLHIAGLLDTPDSGSVFVSGVEATQASDGVRTRIRRQQIGFVYQFHHLLPEFTAAENIVLPQLTCGIPKKIAHDRAMDLLDRVGVASRSSHRPADLSGGEQQRVAFCRALANGPSVLLADEPTGNLDPATAEQVFAAMMGLVHETGLAALVATHNLELARRMDRILRISEGNVT